MQQAMRKGFEERSLEVQRASLELERQKFQWQQLTTIIGALLILGWIKVK